MPTTKKGDVQWSVHTSRLLTEVLTNQSAWILTQPFNIFGCLLHEVAERASELNDPELNKLMVRLTLYEVADPYSPNYDQKVVDQVLEREITEEPKP